MVSRRDFLRVGGLSVVGLSVAERAALAGMRGEEDRRSCIFLLMTGGPSQFETFDPKPDAPAEIRGPLKAISTAVPGLALCETLPRLAERADRFAVLRSLHHDAAPVHETGMQLLQTGRLAHGDVRHPGFGCVVARVAGPRGEVPPYVVLPKLLGQTGLNAYQGQQSGFLGSEYEPLTALSNSESADTEPDDGETPVLSVRDEPESVLREYGRTRFGRLCLQARQLIECGVRCVTVNLFETLAGQTTWDCHARGPSAPANLFDYRDTLGPQFDRALSALLDDLERRGLLADTLVVAVGEFGRTPRVNEFGGRDHWPGVWSAILAGGGVQGGQVIGSSDASGASPADRPIEPGELTATIYQALGLDLETTPPLDDETQLSLTDHQPIAELFG